MNQETKETEPVKRRILVAGDVCLDVVGIPFPGTSPGKTKVDNWRLTGEIRTSYLAGGAFLLADFVQAASPEYEVRAPIPCRPKELTCTGDADRPMDMDEFLGTTERLTRDEIVHSLLNLGVFKETPNAKKAEIIRVNEPHGFSGPKGHESHPSMKILPPEDTDGHACVVVLDDTGNRFRHWKGQWPVVISQQEKVESLVLVYKLHRPLPALHPTEDEKETLWYTVMDKYADRCLVIVSVEDLRDRDAPISRGLSWERTALDLVWQLLNVGAFAPLRNCPHLVVRLGLDGALYWHCDRGEDKPKYYAWLVYDPTGIEGTGISAVPGKMVGYASVFTAVLVHQLAGINPLDFVVVKKDEDGKPVNPEIILEGIKEGLAASRRLLALGFGKYEENGKEPCYPKKELFNARDKLSSFLPIARYPSFQAQRFLTAVTGVCWNRYSRTMLTFSNVRLP